MAAQQDMTRKRGGSDSGANGTPKKELTREERKSRVWATITRALSSLEVEDQKRVVGAMAVLLGMEIAKA